MERYCGAFTALKLHTTAMDISLEPLWGALGPRLTRLAVSPLRSTNDVTFSEELTAMATYCTSLNVLELVYNGHEDIPMPLLEGLDTQLHVLRLLVEQAWPLQDALERVMQLCSNANLHLNFG